MDNTQAIQKFNRLPDVLKKEVSDFIDFLFEKARKDAPKNKPTRGYGLWKDKMEISPDFDEPLEDFKEYME